MSFNQPYFKKFTPSRPIEVPKLTEIWLLNSVRTFVSGNITSFAPESGLSEQEATLEMFVGAEVVWTETLVFSAVTGTFYGINQPIFTDFVNPIPYGSGQNLSFAVRGQTTSKSANNEVAVAFGVTQGSNISYELA